MLSISVSITTIFGYILILPFPISGLPIADESPILFMDHLISFKKSPRFSASSVGVVASKFIGTTSTADHIPISGRGPALMDGFFGALIMGTRAGMPGLDFPKDLDN